MLVFLAGCVLECNLANRRSVAVLFMLFKFKSNPMHPLSDAFHLPYVRARVTRGTFLCPSSLVCSSSVSLWNDLCAPVFDGVGLAGIKSSQCFPVGRTCSFFLSPTIFSFSSFRGLVVLLGWGLLIDRLYYSLSPDLALLTQF